LFYKAIRAFAQVNLENDVDRQADPRQSERMLRMSRIQHRLGWMSM